MGSANGLKKPSNRALFAVLAVSLFFNGLAGLFVSGILDFGSQEPPVAKPAVEIANPYPSLLRTDSVSPGTEVKRTTILNTLIDRYDYRSYLEIGQGHRDQNLDWIDCATKIGVDPNRVLNAAYQMTSDEFFALNCAKFDLIFIDGLHVAEQVEKDILNALDILNENGTIVVHDCNPGYEQIQVVPLPEGQKAWTGDVWKGFVRLRATRSDLTMAVIDTDYGLGIIRRGSQDPIILPEPLTYKDLESHRKQLLNLIDVNAFLEGLKAGFRLQALSYRSL